MQLVLSNNRVLAYGEDCFLAMGGTVICEANGKAYQNATVAETDSPLPSDIDTVGYEYHAGVFVPCAPYGKGAGAVMVACEDCGTPKSSGVTIDAEGNINIPGNINGIDISEHYKHWWKRRSFEEHYEVTEGAFADYAIQRASESSNQKSIKYGTSYVLNADGSLSLSGTTGSVYISYSDSENAEELKGKYFIVSSYSSNGDTGTKYNKVTFGTVYYAPSDADSGTTTSPARIVWINAQPITSSLVQNIGEWEYLSSDNISAYPQNGIDNGYEYEYLGVPFENARAGVKIEYGSYTGTTDLVFSFKPKMVILTSNDSYRNNIIAHYGQTKASSFPTIGTSSSNVVEHPLTWGDNSLVSDFGLTSNYYWAIG